MPTTSLRIMIVKLSAMLGTEDLSEWEEGFVESIAEKSKNGTITTALSEKQVAAIDRLYSKHFA